MTKANKKIITPDRIKELNRDRKIAFALRRQEKSGVSGSQQSGAGLGSGGSSGIDSTKFVRKAGDEMSGPLGFQLKLVEISGGVIDINEDPDRAEAGSHSSNIFLSTEGFTATDDLDTIDKAKFQGQLLFLQATLTQTVTLTSAGNIKPFGGSFALVGDNTILLKWNTVEGKWRQMTGGTGSMSNPSITDLDMGDFSIINKKSQTYNKKLNTSIPTPAANKKTVFYSSDINEIAVKDELGIVTSLEGAGTGDNLGNHIATQDILTDIGDKHDLGSTLKSFQDLYINMIRFPNFDVNPTNFHAIYRDSSDSISFNVPLDIDEIRFRYGGIVHWDFNRFRMRGDNIIVNNILALNDNGTIPASNGFLWRDNTQVHIGSGGKDVILDELAKTNLSNLTTITSINSSLRPQANKDLGSAATPWQSVFTETLDLSQSFAIDINKYEIYRDANNMNFNVPTGKLIIWQFKGSDEMVLSETQLNIGTSKLTLGSLDLGINAIAPAVPGVIRSNGVDVRVFSGGQLRNMSDIGAGGGPEFADNLFRITNQFDSSRKISFNAGAIGSGQTRSYIMQNTSGVLAMLDGAITQISGNDWQFFGDNLDIGNSTLDTLSILSRIDTDFIPKNNNSKDLGSSSREWAKVFADEIHPSDRVRAAGTSEIGFLVENATGAIGSEGTVQLPYTNSAPGSDAAADGLFGAFQGATGFQKAGTGGILYIRDNVGNWSIVATANVF